MKTYQKYLIAALMSLTVMTAATIVVAEDKKADAPATAKQAAPEIVETGWTKRCDEPAKDAKDSKKKFCEVFQAIDVKAQNARMAELAIGFPEKKDVARGGIRLPLGIMLEDTMTLTVDAGKPMAFKVRYCINNGCYAFVNFDKKVIETMKTAKNINFSFKTLESQPVNISISMGGFEKALKEIQ